MGHQEDKIEAQKWAKNLCRKSDWVVLDTDHTGYDDDDTITKVTVVSHSGVILFTRSIPPRKSKGASLRKLLDDLNKTIGTKQVITYNAEFRERIFEQTCEAWGCDWEYFDFECAMLQYSAYVGEPGKGGEYRYQKLPKTGSGEAADCISVINLIKQMSGSEAVMPTTSKPSPEPESLPSNQTKDSQPKSFGINQIVLLCAAGFIIWVLTMVAGCNH